jgi:hypothetical protein
MDKTHKPLQWGNGRFVYTMKDPVHAQKLYLTEFANMAVVLNFEGM